MTVAEIPIKIYTVVMHEAEEGGYWGEILELPGCVSQGETVEEFRNNIREALEAILSLESQYPVVELLSAETKINEEDYRIYTENSSWTAAI